MPVTRWLLACTAALAVAGPAAAQIPAEPLVGPGMIVHDPAASRNVFIELQQWVRQLVYAEQAAMNTLNTYQQAFATAKALAGNFDINNLAATLNRFFANPMPYQSGLAANYLGGVASPAGLPFGQQYLSANTYGGALPAAGTARANQIIQSVYSTSGILAAATNFLQSWEQRQPVMAQIRDQIPRADTAQKLGAVNANINYQNGLTAGWTAAAVNLNTAAAAQRQAHEQRAEQISYAQETAGRQAACSAAASTGISAQVAGCTDPPAASAPVAANAAARPEASFVSAPAGFAPPSAGPNS